ncbi:ATP-binding protein [Spirosoma sordidisoli]|uniref:histidine kinase n=1 Tax=Spirosoma sordidisoli TaxID=2502893 RepID=A0A4Q2UUF7_9BACT|nr:ATP-binding protein [Spirosoma sordidisoli]RYC71591.1 histidine kinase [Spirosoma sordidisoli]
MNSLTLIVCSLLYLSLLFLIAYWAEHRTHTRRSLVNNPYVYSLSLAVYCTAWTFYGSVGRAVSHGMQFLTVYIGPTLAAPLWWLILRKIIRICKAQRITSIADFISARYGKNRGLGVFVTGLCVAGIIPYISIQIKAIATSFSVLSGQAGNASEGLFLGDQAFYITLVLTIFTILFGARTLEATERHEGLVTAVAFESLVKLVAFVAVGLFVTFGLFNGPTDIFQQARAIPALRQQFTFGPGHTSGDWFWNILLSMVAVLFLPRQFQVAVVENTSEKHLDKAIWLFPLYLFVINIFVLPLAFGGHILLGDLPIDADNYVLALPVQYGREGLALLAYIGGFSAATSMIIVETIALSVMVSNNVVMPFLVSRSNWQNRFGAVSSTFVINIRRLTIVLFLVLAYIYYRTVSQQFSLVSVGLISFAAVAQFTPAIIGGIFWKEGNRAGARLGLYAGTAMWFYTLILPTLVPGLLPPTLLTEGPWGIGFLRPQNLFGQTDLEPLAQGIFWSLLVNVLGYLWGSINRPQSALEHNQAVLFVDIFRLSRSDESSVVWKGKVVVSELQRLLTTFFGADWANRVIERYTSRHAPATPTSYADARLVTYCEKLLAGAIGTASARTLVASIAKEETISVDEVIRILKTSQELLSVNRELKRKSTELEQMAQQLSEANERLQAADLNKAEFLSTITHEVRTPITSVRALAEILYDTPDMNDHSRQQFLGTIIRESERLTRLINQVLDLERFESGRLQLQLEPVLLRDIVRQAIDTIQQLIREKNISITVQHDIPPTPVRADHDRLMQVFINLLSNAVKFCEPNQGRIAVLTSADGPNLIVSITDNGVGIDPAYHELIFDKFYQLHHKTRDKPTGSGLGLAISRKIAELHGGSIRVESQLGQGATFTVRIPVD